MENKRTKAVYYVRILAGGYICYIGGQLIVGLINGENTMNPALAILFALVFVVCGGFFAVGSIMYLYKHRNDTVEPVAADDIVDLEEMKDETVEEIEAENVGEAAEKVKEPQQ